MTKWIQHVFLPLFTGFNTSENKSGREFLCNNNTLKSSTAEIVQIPANCLVLQMAAILVPGSVGSCLQKSSDRYKIWRNIIMLLCHSILFGIHFVILLSILFVCLLTILFVCLHTLHWITCVFIVSALSGLGKCIETHGYRYQRRVVVKVFFWCK